MTAREHATGLTAAAGVEELIAAMTLEEKLAQLVGFWEGRGGAGGEGGVAPMQHAMQAETAGFEDFAVHGLGQLTRVYGTAPVDPAAQARALASRQRWLRENTRLGIPAIVHEECLTGLAAWTATTFPSPPAWGASFDPDLVAEMGRAIGESMRALGVHQGLAPVLDVVRDARWGRVEECIAEDPYLVGALGTAYVRGLQGAGVIATLKHFVGYSGSRAGRNLAPVHAGPREISDVFLPPFEMAVRDGGARSVMNAYTEIDGVPVAADSELLTGVLRDRWGFTGTVVADYFSVAFLHTLHRAAADLGDAAAQALIAGIDVELPTGTAYLEPLAVLVRSGVVSEQHVDGAVRRVLEQKRELGLLDASVDPEDAGEVDLDPPAHREVASRLADRSVVLVANDGVLPLAAGTVAVVGPNAASVHALFGCYSFANHVLARHPDADIRLDVATVHEALVEELGSGRVRHAAGCDVRGEDTSGFADALATAAASDVVVAVMGDLAGMFGRGTSGEGCDVETLELPGVQRRFVEELLDVGKPVVLVLVTGRPYAIDWAVDRCAAVVQAFFPGQEGARAIAGVLTGRVNPSGRLPMSLPRSSGGQPAGYLHPPLGAGTAVSNLDTTPVAPFGHGLSYTTFAQTGFRVRTAQVPTDGAVTIEVDVRNTGGRAGAEVVQVYGHVTARGLTRPVTQLLGFARVELAASAAACVELRIPTTRFAYTGRDLRRVVAPGEVTLSLGRSSTDTIAHQAVTLTGPVHEVSGADERLVTVTVNPVDRPA